MNDTREKRRVAIACQGGGSHTAFAAGALKELLIRGQHDYEFVAFSGASGGAICALLAWYGLLEDGPGRAAQLLDDFWVRDNPASAPWEKIFNDSLVGLVRWQQLVGLLVEQDPGFWSEFWQHRLKLALKKNICFGKIDKNLVKPSSPMLFVGAVDVLTGEFKVFRSHKPQANSGENGSPFVFDEDPARGISVAALLASCAIPPIFRAVRIGDGVYWDGLYSQNPPVSDLPDANPDEIWIIQINPNKLGKDPKPKNVPTTMANIVDRRDELAGNLSLNQELRFIRKINRLIDGGLLVGGKYRRIEVREPIENSESLDYATKLDRDPYFVKRMMARGEMAARAFLDGLPHA